MTKTSWPPEGFERPVFTAKEVKAVLAEVHASIEQHIRDYGDGIFIHPHEIVGCMTGQLKKLSEAADDSMYTPELQNFRHRCYKTLMAMVVALVSVDKLAALRKAANPEEPVVYIGNDGRCQCDCGTKCPLGRAGMETRCTKEELEAAGIRTKNP